MSKQRIVAGVANLCIVLGVATASYAQQQEKFPSRPIEIIATFGPGGGADLMARKMSQLLEPELGVALPVSNTVGASGNAGLTKLLNSPADGHTVATLIALSVSSWTSGIGTARTDDFTILAIIQDSPSMLFVPMDSPFKTFKDFLAYAKANPGKLKVATSGYGTQDDITLRYLESLGYKTINVPFAKPAERYASPLGKHTDAIYEEPGDVAQFLASNDLRPLVVFDDVRHFAFPNVLASKELGMEISDLPNFRTLAVLANTPPEKVKVLAEKINHVLDTPEWKKYCTVTYTCARKYTSEQAKARVKDFYTTVESYLKKFATDSK